MVKVANNLLDGMPDKHMFHLPNFKCPKCGITFWVKTGEFQMNCRECMRPEPIEVTIDLDWIRNLAEKSKIPVGIEVNIMISVKKGNWDIEHYNQLMEVAPRVLRFLLTPTPGQKELLETLLKEHEVKNESEEE